MTVETPHVPFRIQDLLPHRYPMLMVDAIRELDPGKSGVAVKNVTCNEQFFVGHFPGHPIMPGVLTIECVAQVAGAVLAADLSREQSGETSKSPPYLLSVDNFKFRRPIVPGDTLVVTVKVQKRFGNMARIYGEVCVDGTVVASGELSVGGG
jgi:3-hydroxyacyl-[acyl-carrier-protein] dehydratase